MTFVYATNLISRAKVAGQHVQFQLKNGSRWIRCLNPFGKDLKEMSLPIPGSNDFFLSEAPPILQYNKLSPEERKSFFSDQADLTEEDFPKQFNTITTHPAGNVLPQPTPAPAPAFDDPVAFPPIITIDADGSETEPVSPTNNSTIPATSAAVYGMSIGPSLASRLITGTLG